MTLKKILKFPGLGCQCVHGSIVRLDSGSKPGAGLSCDMCSKDQMPTRDQRSCIKCPSDVDGKCSCSNRQILSKFLNNDR